MLARKEANQSHVFQLAANMVPWARLILQPFPCRRYSNTVFQALSAPNRSLVSLNRADLTGVELKDFLD